MVVFVLKVCVDHSVVEDWQGNLPAIVGGYAVAQPHSTLMFMVQHPRLSGFTRYTLRAQRTFTITSLTQTCFTPAQQRKGLSNIAISSCQVLGYGCVNKSLMTAWQWWVGLEPTTLWTGLELRCVSICLSPLIL